MNGGGVSRPHVSPEQKTCPCPYGESVTMIPWNLSSASRMVSGCGGHPGMNRSIGTVLHAPFSVSGWLMNGPPLIAQVPQAIASRGPGRAAHVFSRASAMFSLTGPVINNASACRGDATNWIPNLPMSHAGVPSTFESASHALHPAAETCRSFKDL